MKLKDIFGKKEINLSKTVNSTVKIDKKQLAKLTGGFTETTDHHKVSDNSAGKGSKGG